MRTILIAILALLSVPSCGRSLDAYRGTPDIGGLGPLVDLGLAEDRG